MAIELTSQTFEDGAPLPRAHTCDGDDISPPLAWNSVPEEAESLALICEDPDAPGRTWVHWLAWNIAPSARSLPAGAASRSDGGLVQGLNDFKRPGYGGACPPPGKPHRYIFHLYALKKRLDLKPGATRRELEQAMKGAVLDEGTLTGIYGRPA